MSESNSYEWLIETLERYSIDFANNTSLDLSAWLDENSRGAQRAEMLFSLLHVEAELKNWDLSWLQARLRTFGQQLDDREFSALNLIRRVTADAMECSGSARVTWSLLESFGFQAEHLHVAGFGDPYYLGQCLLNRYRLEQRIGHGRFGVVYRAVDLQTGTDVAIKALRIASVYRETALRLMREEVRVLQELTVTGVPRLLLSSLDAEHPFFVMQYASGKSLRSCLQSEAFSIQRSLTLILKLAMIVHATHLQKLIHRDLKPENILLTTDDQVFVVDFGIALREAVQFGSAKPDRVGSYAYMAPEALAGLGRQLDARTDVYSLGIILYELLTGDCPIDDSSTEEAFVSALRAPKSLSFPASVPVNVREIILKSIENEPFERFDSAADFASAAESALAECCRQAAGPDHSSTDLVYDRKPLIAWRSGMRMGRCIECHIVYIHHLRLLDKTWQSTGSPEASHKAMRDAVGYLQWTMISHQELMQLIGQIGTAVLPFPDEEQYRRMFNRSKAVPSAEQIESLIQQRSEIDQTLDRTFASVQQAFTAADERCAILFELACRLVMEKRSGDDSTELLTLCKSSRLPEELWQEYMAVLESNAPANDQDIALQKFDREVQRLLQA